MREPGTLTRGRDTKGRINALIEDLGLSQVSRTIMIVMMMMMIVIVNTHYVGVAVENQLLLFSDSTDFHKSQVKHTRVADLTVSL